MFSTVCYSLSLTHIVGCSWCGAWKSKLLTIQIFRLASSRIPSADATPCQRALDAPLAGQDWLVAAPGSKYNATLITLPPSADIQIAVPLHRGEKGHQGALSPGFTLWSGSS